jgi:hypothetical protein
MTTENAGSKLFITGGEWLYQLEVRGIGHGSILFWRTRSLDPHTRYPNSEVRDMSQNTTQQIGLNLERSWMHHVMIAGEEGYHVPPIALAFDEEEF